MERGPADLAAVPRRRRATRLLRRASLPLHHPDDPVVVEPGTQLSADDDVLRRAAGDCTARVPRSQPRRVRRFAAVRHAARQGSEMARSRRRRTGTLLRELRGTVRRSRVLFCAYIIALILLLYCMSLITLRAKLSAAVYCNRSCLWVCLFAGLLP